MKNFKKNIEKNNNIENINESLNKILEFEKFETIKSDNVEKICFKVRKDWKDFVIDEDWNKTKEYDFSLDSQSFYLEDSGFTTWGCSGWIDLRDNLWTQDHYMWSKLLDFHWTSLSNNLYWKNTRSITLSNIPRVIKSLIDYSKIFTFINEDNKVYLTLSWNDEAELTKNKQKLKEEIKKEIIKRIDNGLLDKSLLGESFNNLVEDEVSKYIKFEYKAALYINGEKINEWYSINTLESFDWSKDDDLSFYTMYNPKNDSNDLYLGKELIKESSTLPMYNGWFIHWDDLPLRELQKFNKENYFMVDLKNKENYSYMSWNKILKTFNNWIKNLFFDNKKGIGLKDNTLEWIYIQDNDNNIHYNDKLIWKYEYLSQPFENKNIFLWINKGKLNILKDWNVIGFLENNKDNIWELINDFKYNRDKEFFKDIYFKDNDDVLLNEYLIAFNNDWKQVIIKDGIIVKEIEENQNAKYFYKEDDKVKCKIIKK